MPEASIPTVRLRHGRVYWISYRCRDIGYGVEEGEGEFIALGRETLAWKIALMPVDGGDTLYLFDDEITDCAAATV